MLGVWEQGVRFSVAATAEPSDCMLAEASVLVVVLQVVAEPRHTDRALFLGRGAQAEPWICVAVVVAAVPMDLRPLCVWPRLPQLRQTLTDCLCFAIAFPCYMHPNLPRCRHHNPSKDRYYSATLFDSNRVVHSPLHQLNFRFRGPPQLRREHWHRQPHELIEMHSSRRRDEIKHDVH